jgi:hypothetical protein
MESPNSTDRRGELPLSVSSFSAASLELATAVPSAMDCSCPSVLSGELVRLHTIEPRRIARIPRHIILSLIPIGITIHIEKTLTRSCEKSDHCGDVAHLHN